MEIALYSFYITKNKNSRNKGLKGFEYIRIIINNNNKCTIWNFEKDIKCCEKEC